MSSGDRGIVGGVVGRAFSGLAGASDFALGVTDPDFGDCVGVGDPDLGDCGGVASFSCPVSCSDFGGVFASMVARG